MSLGPTDTASLQELLEGSGKEVLGEVQQCGVMLIPVDDSGMKLWRQLYRVGLHDDLCVSFLLSKKDRIKFCCGIVGEAV